MNNILSIIDVNVDMKRKRATINANELNLIVYKTKKEEITSIYIDENTRNIIKALKTGEI